MEKEIFVMINSENLAVISDKINCNVNFKEKEIRSVNPDVIAIILRETLDKFSLSDDNIILIPDSEYIICSEKITADIKKQNVQENASSVFFDRIFVPAKNTADFVFRQQVKYIFNGKVYQSPDAIPLLQKYFVNKQTTEYERNVLSKLLSSLEDCEIGVKGIIPLVSLYKSYQKIQSNVNRTIFLTFSEDKSIATVKEDGIIAENIVVNCGMNKIIEDVSNSFDLSLKISKKLIDMYGFVFLPKEYVNYLIDIPVYGKLMQSVGLTELSYCIRESFKEIINELVSSLSSKMKDYDINSEFISTFSLKLNGANTLLDLILNREISVYDSSSLNYADLSYGLNKLRTEDYEEKLSQSAVKEKLVESIETQPALIDKLTNIFNSRIKPYLVDPEL
ncbi:MAG TPA: hypothetical protein PLL66_07885 [Bacteroidales bacterium]|nr:hypothetical protein [Bacteroidales bacterium]